MYGCCHGLVQTGWPCHKDGRWFEERFIGEVRDFETVSEIVCLQSIRMGIEEEVEEVAKYK